MTSPLQPAPTRNELDRQLVDRYLAGDQSAFAELYNEHKPRAYVTALRFVYSHQDAEEVAQDAMLRVVGNLANFRWECSFVTWLHCITQRLAFNRHHYNKRRRVWTNSSLDFEYDSERGPTTLGALIADDNAEDAGEAMDMEIFQSELLPHGLARLNEKHRTIIELRFKHNMDYTAIANRMDMRLGTVKSTLARARENLRGHLLDAHAPLVA